jgi:hypothetical protein
VCNINGHISVILTVILYYTNGRYNNGHIIATVGIFLAPGEIFSVWAFTRNGFSVFFPPGETFSCAGRGETFLAPGEIFSVWASLFFLFFGFLSAGRDFFLRRARFFFANGLGESFFKTLERSFFSKRDFFCQHFGRVFFQNTRAELFFKALEQSTRTKSKKILHLLSYFFPFPAFHQSTFSLRSFPIVFLFLFVFACCDLAGVLLFRVCL